MNLSVNYITKILEIAKLRTKLYIIIFLSIFSSILDILSLGLLIPIINLFMNKKDNLSSNFEEIFWLNNFLKIEFLVLCFCITFFLKTFLSISIYRYISKIRLNLQADLRLKLLKKYQKLDYTFFLKRQSSDYIQNITAAVSSYSNVLMGFLRIIGEIIIITVILIYLFILDSKTVLILLPIFLIIIFTYQILFRKKIINIGKIINKNSKNIIQIVKDSINGMKEIKISNREIFFLNQLENKAKSLAKNNLIYETIVFSPRHVIELILILLISIYFFFGGFDFNNSSAQMTILLTSYGYAAFRLIPSFSLISRLLAIMNNGVVYTDILYEDIRNNNNQFELKQSIEIPNKIKFQNIQFKNVSFRYENQQEILEDISIKINKGDSIIITGPSGSGKTTFVDLILGLLKPSNGQIDTYDELGNKITLNKLSYYVSQKKFLFNETIFKNIVLVDHLNTFDDLNNEQQKLFNNAIEFSGVNEITNSNREKLYSLIGEDGSLLSGGQKQRVAIARAIYADRDLIILDESTSALDKNLELEVSKHLINLTHLGKTIICITHNTSLIKYFKSHYDIENNRLIKLK